MVVYVVTYWDKDTEPVITVFSNKESAMNCYNNFKPIHYDCIIDECNVYTKFEVTNHEQHT